MQPPIRRHSRCVHLLPAAPDHHFSPVGLLQLGLELAFYSLQGSHAHIFSGRSTFRAPSARTALAPGYIVRTLNGSERSR